MNYFEQIEAMHQAVREFVEQAQPNFKVAGIVADFTTIYKPTLASEEFILAEIKAQFRVEAHYINKILTCKVWILENKLYMADQTLSSLSRV